MNTDELAATPATCLVTNRPGLQVPARHSGGQSDQRGSCLRFACLEVLDDLFARLAAADSLDRHGGQFRDREKVR